MDAADQYPVRAEFFAKCSSNVVVSEKIPESSIGFSPDVGINLNQIVTALSVQGFLEQGFDRSGALEFVRPARIEGQIV